MNIIIAEDEKIIREGLCKIIERMNPAYHVIGMVRDGKEALALMQSEDADVLLLDIQMPVMNGLELLTYMREQNINLKVIVMSAYSDFTYAKKAIEMGVENYLLKPLKIEELSQTLENIDKKMTFEKNSKQILVLEQIVKGIVTSQISFSESIVTLLQREYGINCDEKVYILGFFYEQEYNAEYHTMNMLLSSLQDKLDKAHMCYFPMEKYHVWLVCFYPISLQKEFSHYLRHSLVPSILSQTGKDVVITYKLCSCWQHLDGALEKLKHATAWNLVMPDSILSYSRIKLIKPYLFQYPVDIEKATIQSVQQLEETEYKKHIREFQSYCLQQVYYPQDIREACIRYGYAIISAAQEEGRSDGKGGMMQNVLQDILNAMCWDRILEILQYIYNNMCFEQPYNEADSLLIKRAKAYVQDYFDRGITLEEVADKLHVSAEYLSRMYKKETGVTFSEAIRKIRIKKAKQLLTSTDMKLNQIAAFCGYADPKYMSKVFKQETGALPMEYRRLYS